VLSSVGLRGLCTKSRDTGRWFDRLTTNGTPDSPFSLSLSKGKSLNATIVAQGYSRAREF
jgi:hypothetical protein